MIYTIRAMRLRSGSMKDTIEIDAVATVTSDGNMTVTVPAPASCNVGEHKIKILVAASDAKAQYQEALQNLPQPKRYFKGRPVYDREDRKHMSPLLPPEEEWGKELGAE